MLRNFELALKTDDVGHFTELLKNIEDPTVKALLTARDHHRRDPLMRAIGYKSYRVALLLLRANCGDLGLLDDKNRSTLDYANDRAFDCESKTGENITKEVLLCAVRMQTDLGLMSDNKSFLTGLLLWFGDLFPPEMQQFRLAMEEFKSKNPHCSQDYAYRGYHFATKPRAKLGRGHRDPLDSSWQHKLHISLNFNGDINLFITAWKILLEINKEFAVSGIKQIDKFIKHYQPGKECVIYFSNKNHVFKMSDAEFLARHILIMRNVDRMIATAKLTAGNPPRNLFNEVWTDEYSTTALGCTTNAVFISPPDRAYDDNKHQFVYLKGTKQRETPVEHPYQGECVVLANLYEASPVILQLLEDEAPQFEEFKQQLLALLGDEVETFKEALRTACKQELNAFSVLRATYVTPFIKGDGYKPLYRLFDKYLSSGRLVTPQINSHHEKDFSHGNLRNPGC